MENLNIRKRVFENLGDLHYTADVYKIFGDEQKKYQIGRASCRERV